MLNASDFENFEYSMLMKNTTTQTEIHDSNKIRISEFKENGMVLQLPSGACSSGHMLLFEVLPDKRGYKVHQFPKPGEIKGSFSITCKVTETEQAKKAGFALFTVELLQYSVNDWKSFQQKFLALQNNVNKIFKIIKE